MESSPCRRIHLPGIAHPVMKKYFKVLEVYRGIKYIQELSCEKGQIRLIHVFCKILDIHPVYVKFWVEDPFSVYVRRTEL